MTRHPRRAVLRLLPALATSALAWPLMVVAQMFTRQFPRTALRGEIGFAAYPDVVVNGKPARLSPGARVRDLSSMVAMHGNLAGQKFIANYTLNSMGMVQDVWLLRKEEIARQPWPRTLQEAQTWTFDEASQVWTKP